MQPTATDPRGTVHVIAHDNVTNCGQDASGWSRAITIAQLAGLVIFCEACNE
jgi:hypothetical protein